MTPLGLLPVLTGSKTLIVREGLSWFPAAAPPAPAAAAMLTLGAALGAAGVLKLLGSEAAAAGSCCFAFSVACRAQMHKPHQQVYT